MALLPVYPRIKPPGTDQFKNGEIPASYLEIVPMAGPDAQVQKEYARCLKALIHDCKAATGLDLSHVGDYRDIQEQINLLIARYNIVACPAGQRYWNGKCWAKKPNVAVVATPGTSDHGWGLALDGCWWLTGPDGKGKAVGIAGLSDGWAWIRTNLTRYGLCWAWDEMDEEPWHWHLYAMNTAAVLAYEAGQLPPPPPPPTPAPGFKHDIPQPTLREGSSGPEVVKLQLVLKFWKWYPPEFQNDTADGQFGGRTKTGVVNMQKAFGIGADGVYGVQTATRYDNFLTDMDNVGSPECAFPTPPAGGFRRGDSGVGVKDLQAQLSWHGVAIGILRNALTLDGVFGNETYGAVVTWQSYLISVNRLPAGGADGVFGNQTRAAACGLVADVANL